MHDDDRLPLKLSQVRYLQKRRPLGVSATLGLHAFQQPVEQDFKTWSFRVSSIAS